MIDFEIKPLTREVIKMTNEFSEKVVRKISRYYDEYAHEHEDMKDEELRLFKENLKATTEKLESNEPAEPPILTRVMITEERSWGGCLVGSAANPTGLGNAAIDASQNNNNQSYHGNQSYNHLDERH